MRLRNEDAAAAVGAAREVQIVRRPFAWGKEEEREIGVGVGRACVFEGFEVFEE
jgi:hypothetical protein